MQYTALSLSFLLAASPAVALPSKNPTPKPVPCTIKDNENFELTAQYLDTMKMVNLELVALQEPGVNVSSLVVKKDNSTQQLFNLENGRLYQGLGSDGKPAPTSFTWYSDDAVINQPFLFTTVTDQKAPGGNITLSTGDGQGCIVASNGEPTGFEICGSKQATEDTVYYGAQDGNDDCRTVNLLANKSKMMRL